MTTGDGDRVIPFSYLKQRSLLKYHLYVYTELVILKATALLSHNMRGVHRHLLQVYITRPAVSLASFPSCRQSQK